MDILNYFVLLTGHALIEDDDFNFWKRLDDHFGNHNDVLPAVEALMLDVEQHSRELADRRGLPYELVIARKNISAHVASLETRTVPEAMLGYLMENYPDRVAKLGLKALAGRILAKRAEAAKPRRKL